MGLDTQMRYIPSSAQQERSSQPSFSPLTPPASAQPPAKAAKSVQFEGLDPRLILEGSRRKRVPSVRQQQQEQEIETIRSSQKKRKAAAQLASIVKKRKNQALQPKSSNIQLRKMPPATATSSKSNKPAAKMTAKSAPATLQQPQPKKSRSKKAVGPSIRQGQGTRQTPVVINEVEPENQPSPPSPESQPVQRVSQSAKIKAPPAPIPFKVYYIGTFNGQVVY